MSDRFDEEEDDFQDFASDEETQASNVHKFSHPMKSSHKKNPESTKVITVEQLKEMEIKFAEVQQEKESLRKELEEIKRSTSQENRRLQRQNDEWKRQCSQIIAQKEHLKQELELQRSFKKDESLESSINLQIDSNIQPPAGHYSHMLSTLSEDIQFGRECGNCSEKQKQINRLQYELDENKRVMEDIVEDGKVQKLEDEVLRLREEINEGRKREQELEMQLSFLRGDSQPVSVHELNFLQNDDNPIIHQTRSKILNVLELVQHIQKEIKITQSKIVNSQVDQIEDMQKKLMELNNEMASEFQKVDDFESKIKELEEKLEQKNYEIEMLVRGKSQGQEEIFKLKRIIEESDKVVTQLNSELAKLKSQNGDFSVQIRQKTSEIHALQEKVVSLKSKIVTLEIEVQDAAKKSVLLMQTKNTEASTLSVVISQKEKLAIELSELMADYEKVRLELDEQRFLRKQEQQELQSAKWKLNNQYSQYQTIFSECQSLTEKVHSLEAQKESLLKNKNLAHNFEGQISALRQEVIAFQQNLRMKDQEILHLKEQESLAQQKIRELELLQISLNALIETEKQQAQNQSLKITEMQSIIQILQTSADQTKVLEAMIDKLKNPRTIKEKFEVVRGWFELKVNERKYEYQPRPASRVRENIELMNWIEEYFRMIVAEAVATGQGDFY